MTILFILAFVSMTVGANFVSMAQNDQPVNPIGRWTGKFYADPGSRCGSGFDDISFTANIGETFVEGEFRHKRGSWRFQQTIASNDSFFIWTTMGLLSDEQDVFIDANVKLTISPGAFERAYDQTENMMGDFFVVPPTDEFLCSGYFIVGRPVSEPPAANGISRIEDQGHAANLPHNPVSESEIEDSFWNSIKDGTAEAEFQAYLDQYPTGKFASLARARLVALLNSRQHIRPAAPGADLGSASYADLHFGAYHAMIIGIDRYRHMAPLQMAGADARAIAQLLHETFGFETRLLLDASRSDIIDALANYRTRLKFDDNFLIYYAGRGARDEVTQRAYWFPADATPNSPSNWISTSDITAMVQAIRAKHVMVVADSVYSGILIRGVSERPAMAHQHVAWIERLLGKRSRTALTSGGLHPVVAPHGRHSVFAKTFLQVLGRIGDVFDGQRLFDVIKDSVIIGRGQTPQYSDIRRADHDGGDFVFVRQRR